MAFSDGPSTSNMSLDSYIDSFTPNPHLFMPWTTENRPPLVRFGDTSGEGDPWSIPRPKLRYCKRKCDLDYNLLCPPPFPWTSRPLRRPSWRKGDSHIHKRKPAKILLTEEKMVAQLKNMHISNDCSADQVLDVGMDKSTLADSLLHKLILSNEVKNISSFQDPLIPQALLPKMEKPTRALVLWKPPGSSLRAQIISRLQSREDKEDNNVNNNSTAPDLNAMETRCGSSTTEMEL